VTRLVQSLQGREAVPFTVDLKPGAGAHCGQ
jgi:hypothetical protein